MFLHVWDSCVISGRRARTPFLFYLLFAACFSKYRIVHIRKKIHHRGFFFDFVISMDVVAEKLRGLHSLLGLPLFSSGPRMGSNETPSCERTIDCTVKMDSCFCDSKKKKQLQSEAVPPAFHHIKVLFLSGDLLWLIS